MSEHNQGCVPPTARPAWQQLKRHHQDIAKLHLRDLFSQDPERANRFFLHYDGIFLDYSKHLITDDTVALLLKLTTESELQKKIDGMFSGAIVNLSEQRPALHTALRKPPGDKLIVNGEDVCKFIQRELQRVDDFVTALHTGQLRGSTGKPINTLVNIGIGGSDLGPRLVAEALRDYWQPGINLHFVANIDPYEISSILQQVSAETTLFVISSKSFTTLETLLNAHIAKQWLAAHGCDDMAKHFVAVTANVSAAEQFGVAPGLVFHIRDWVGGRYSLWSSIGLPVAAVIGMTSFRALLNGAHQMDEHFRSAPLHQNIPVILGMLDIWYINFFGANTLACIPYDQRLARLPDYLAQLFMESNGKSVDQHNQPVNYATGAIVWGGVGTNAQHAFMQLLHQGTHLVPADLLAGLSANADKSPEQRQDLLANCIAQASALMEGNVQSPEMSYKHVPGNKPVTTLMFDKLAPETLGMLLAMYEHRVFVQAAIWNINPFDQWGVELGKTLAQDIKNQLTGINNETALDTSTRHLIDHCRRTG